MAAPGLTYDQTSGMAAAARRWKLLALAGLAVLLSAATVGVASALKTPTWSSLWQSLLLGLLLGWGLAVLNQPGWRTAAIILLIGLADILLFPAGLAREALQVALELGRLALQLMIYPASQNMDFASLLHAGGALRVSAGVVLIRLAAWTSALVTGEPDFDPVAAALAWNALIWCLAAWGGWILQARRSALLAGLPSILLSVATLGYARRLSPVLYLMLGAMLVVLAVVAHQQRQQRWDALEVAYPSQKGRQILGGALLAATGLVLISGLLSSSAVQRFQEWLVERRRPAVEHETVLAKSLGILPNGTVVPDVFAAASVPSLPREHLIGSGPELSQRPVMTIATGDSQVAVCGRGKRSPVLAEPHLRCVHRAGLGLEQDRRNPGPGRRTTPE